MGGAVSSPRIVAIAEPPSITSAKAVAIPEAAIFVMSPQLEATHCVPELEMNVAISLDADDADFLLIPR